MFVDNNQEMTWEDAIEIIEKSVKHLRTDLEKSKITNNALRLECKDALKYDRGQYGKGYVDGVREFVKTLKDKALALHKSLDENCLYQISNSFIDKVVDEMVGDGNDA